MQIKINLENIEKIEAALKAVNGAANAHTYSGGDILKMAEDCEKRLLSLVSKKSAPGARVVSTSGGKVPNCYKYSRQATYIEIERRPAGWYLVAVASANLYQQGGKTRMILNQSQDVEAVNRFRFYDVVTTPTL